MGDLTSSENSLNQHIKNKHKELWETIKARCENEGVVSEIGGDREDGGREENFVDFENND